MNRRKINFNQNNVPESVGRFVGGAIGLIFGGVGITVLIFLWGTPFNEFGSPPLFFRVIGSFIALSTVLVGGGSFFAMLIAGKNASGRSLSILDASEEDASREEYFQPRGSLNYTCPNCGAPLSSGIEVSPHGDAKCTFCHGWFNIHGK